MGAVRILLLALALAAAPCSAAPRRVVCLGPSLTETVFALGCGHRVVGVSDYASWPEAVRGLPRVGGLMDPILGRILALRPDLLLLAAHVPALERFARRESIPVRVIQMDDIQGVLRGIRRTGRLLGCARAGRRLARRVERELEAVRSPEPLGVHVLIQVGRPPGPGLKGLVVAGGRTFLSQLVRLAGGDNVFEDAASRYFSPSLEQVLQHPPEVVLVLDAGATHADSETSELRSMWRSLLGPGPRLRVVLLTDPVFVVPGPRMGEAARRLGALLAGAGAGR